MTRIQEKKKTKNIKINFKKILKNMLTKGICGGIVYKHLREWRNRQTRTFEGRVVIPYGFKSRLSHQDLGYLTKVFFLCLSLAKMRLNP